MIQHRTNSQHIVTAITLLLLALVANVAPLSSEDKNNAVKTLPDDLATQIKEMQKQIAELQKHMSEMQKPRIIAAGTATFKLGLKQDNTSSVRIKLTDEIIAKLGEEYIVLVTTRLPATGFYYTPYWKPANDGFDLMLIDPEAGPGKYRVFRSPPQDFLIDWIVVKK